MKDDELGYLEEVTYSVKFYVIDKEHCIYRLTIFIWFLVCFSFRYQCRFFGGLIVIFHFGRGNTRMVKLVFGSTKGRVPVVGS